MPLNAGQINDHLRELAEDQLAAEGMNREVILWWMRACIRHWRKGDADSREAARTIATAIAERTLGRSLTSHDLHMLQSHWPREADASYDGELR